MVLVVPRGYLFVFPWCHVVEIRASFNRMGMDRYAYRQRKRIDFSLFRGFLNSDRDSWAKLSGTTGNHSACSIFIRPRQPERFKAVQTTPSHVLTSYVRALILPERWRPRSRGSFVVSPCFLRI